jgi:LDH2 family malate/lactate/ureidoglycolate dehydrogenase
MLVEHNALRMLAQAVLAKVGVPSTDAELVAGTLVEADLRGVHTHGVMRLPIYVKRIKAGVVNPAARVRILASSAAGRLVDGQNGLGQVVSRQAMALAMNVAAEQGVAAIAIRNSNHAGIIGLYAEQATTAGMIGFYTTSGAPSVAPTGGVKPMLGSNPFAVGIPTGRTYPILLDCASTVVARANLLLARLARQSIPLGWALDSDGMPTTDPEAGLKGTMLPFGGHKGYGIALMVDILSGALSGALCGPWIPAMYGDLDHPQGIGHFLLALNVGAFVPLRQFYESVNSLVQVIKSSEKAEGVEEIFVPGEIEFRRRDRALREGVSLSPEVAQELKALADDLGVEMPV